MARRQQTGKRATFVLFGATGDLAVKKIFPALDRISAEAGFDVVAVSRRDWDDAGFRDFIKKSGSEVSDGFIKRVSYAKVDVEAGSGYESLAEKTGSFPGEAYVYLSLAPQFHAKAFESLVGAGILARGRGKLLIEKPFGTDERSARLLDDLISSKLDDGQLYRIDHYLGKETVLAIMDLHESTPDFDRMIAKESVSSIRVRLTETKGIDGRGASYDSVGAFRDVGQNHMLEVLAALGADISGEKSWQSARAEVIERLAPPAKTCEMSRRGQYDGYGAEKGVKLGSETETAFEITTSLSSGKLKGVPLVLESGKKMERSEAYAEILFADVSGLPRSMMFSIQPEQKIMIEYRNGEKDAYDIPKKRDAYENVILAALRGSDREFVGREEIAALWSYADHVVACWDKVPLEKYSPEKTFKFESR